MDSKSVLDTLYHNSSFIELDTNSAPFLSYSVISLKPPFIAFSLPIAASQQTWPISVDCPTSRIRRPCSQRSEIPRMRSRQRANTDFLQEVLPGFHRHISYPSKFTTCLGVNNSCHMTMVQLLPDDSGPAIAGRRRSVLPITKVHINYNNNLIRLQNLNYRNFDLALRL